MKILVIGDTHGKLHRVREIFTKLKGIDLIVHTGDLITDAQALEREFGIPVTAVKGNCDGSYSKEDFQIISTEYGKLLVTHGHMEQVGYTLNNLMYKTLEQDCKAALFGHTHKALVEETNGIHLINPGSLTLPRDNSGGSYAIVRTTPDTLEASIVYYNTVMGPDREKNKVQTGFVRNLLNYSDRF